MPGLSGSWSWWTRPRAVAYGGKTYVGSHALDKSVNVDVYTGKQDTPSRVQVAVLPEFDDHNNPSVIVKAGRPVVVTYQRHSADNLLRYRKAAQNVEDGLSFSAAEKTLDVGSAITYTVAHTHGTDSIYLLFRTHPSAANSNQWTWSYARSTDFGGTFTFGKAVFRSATQFYMASQRAGTDTLRITLSTHPVNEDPPNQNIYYGEVNLSTGAITKSDGTVVGNMLDTSAAVEVTTLELLASPPTSGYRTWVYDVSDAADPEVTWVSFAKGSQSSTAMYHYSKRVSGSWVTRDIVAAGNHFSGGEEPYAGGAQMPYATPGGRVYLSREASGTWYLERRDTADGGLTWTVTRLADPVAQTTARLVRVWPTEQRDSTETHEAFANRITRWGTPVGYIDHDSTIQGYSAAAATLRRAGQSVTATYRRAGTARTFTLRRNGQTVT